MSHAKVNLATFLDAFFAKFSYLERGAQNDSIEAVGGMLNALHDEAPLVRDTDRA